MQGQETALQPPYFFQPPSTRTLRHCPQLSHVRSVPPRTINPLPPGSVGVASRGSGGGGHLSVRKHPPPGSPTKVPIQPPVCAVQPGRVLSLRTALGLKHARALLAQQQQQQQQQQQAMQLQQYHHQHAGPADMPLASSWTRAQLKQARLQPLGIVDGIQPMECLGVVPVTSVRGKSNRRPKSCTAPPTQVSDLREEDHAPQLPHDRVKVLRKRSSSAILPRNIPDDALRQLLSITRHAATLPPQQQKEGERGHVSEHAQECSAVEEDVVTDSLPSMSSSEQAEFIRISMRGLKRNLPLRGPGSKGSSRDGSRSIPSETQTPRREAGSKIANHSSQHSRSRNRPHLPLASPTSTTTSTAAPATGSASQTSKFPSISEPEEDRDTTLSITVTRTKEATGTPRDDLQPSASTPPEPPLPPRSGGTSGGEGKVGGASKHKSRRQLSGKGRLSQGWSPPQPIGPLKGSPIHTPPRGVGEAGSGGGSDRGGAKATPTSEQTGVSSTSLVISVNVNEFLTPTDQAVSDD